MSADLLRRAAVKLREHAEATTEGPWTVEAYEDGNSDDILFYAFGPVDERGHRAIPFQTRTEDAGHYSQAEADMAYGVLMHPPVALALAELLVAVADQTAALRHPTRFGDYNTAVALAREILREPQP